MCIHPNSLCKGTDDNSQQDFEIDHLDPDSTLHYSSHNWKFEIWSNPCDGELFLTALILPQSCVTRWTTTLFHISHTPERSILPNSIIDRNIAQMRRLHIVCKCGSDKDRFHICQNTQNVFPVCQFCCAVRMSPSCCLSKWCFQCLQKV